MRPGLLALALVFAASTVRAELPPLIPREVIFSAPENIYPQIAPDGRRLAWLAPDKEGVLQIWVRTVGKDDGKQVSNDKKRPIFNFTWAEDARTILYTQDSDGDENDHIYAIDLDAGSVRDLTPFQGVSASWLPLNAKLPSTILVMMNLRDRKWMDVHRIDLKTGAVALEVKNPGDVGDWMVDPNLVVRGAYVNTPEGGTELRWRADANSPWKTLLKAPPEEIVDLQGFSPDGKSIFLKTSIGIDKARLVQRDLKSGVEKELAKDDEVDVEYTLIHPRRFTPLGAVFEKDTREWKVLDAGLRADWDEIRKLAGGAIGFTSMDKNDQLWVVEFEPDNAPLQYWLWDRAAKKGTFLFVHRPKLKAYTLAPMKGIKYTARDGMTIHGYLTLPAGVEPKKLPLVLMPHGGPWARDTWGYVPEIQQLANRGYAVLQPNFRGSTGYGKKFLHAGDRQWGKKMHDDLADAVKWAIAEGVADPKRVAIYGFSYGGYSALAGATFTPDLFRCAIDVFGVSNLMTFMSSIPPYWATFKSILKTRVGDSDDPKDVAMLREASPLFAADKIKVPLLIGQGQNDVRVTPPESEQILAAVERNGGRATYVLYSDEGHGFLRAPNRNDFYARAEKFLAEQLGGRFEPLGEIKGSTAIVKEVGKKK